MEGVKQQPRWRSDQSLERGVYLCVCVCVYIWWGCIGYRCFLCFYKRKKILTVSRRFAWIRSAGWPAPSMPFVARYSPTISDSKPTRRKVKSQGSQWSAQAHEKSVSYEVALLIFLSFPLAPPSSLLCSSYLQGP